MLLKTILNRVERHKSFVYEDGTFVTDKLNRIKSLAVLKQEEAA